MQKLYLKTVSPLFVDATEDEGHIHTGALSSAIFIGFVHILHGLQADETFDVTESSLEVGEPSEREANETNALR